MKESIFNILKFSLALVLFAILLSIVSTSYGDASSSPAQPNVVGCLGATINDRDCDGRANDAPWPFTDIDDDNPDVGALVDECLMCDIKP